VHFADERAWAAELVATINEQVDAIANLPARSPAEERQAAELRRRAIELQHWARTIERGVQFKAMARENAALRRQVNRLDNARH
jgi:cell division protein FtsB